MMFIKLTGVNTTVWVDPSDISTMFREIPQKSSVIINLNEKKTYVSIIILKSGREIYVLEDLPAIEAMIKELSSD